MSLTATMAAVKHREWSPIPDDFDIQDSSPFGLQGLARETIQILKPEFVNRLAVVLALRATAQQIQDPGYVNRILSHHPDWFDEYQVVHLIEKSLWIQGHSDLVMTMTRNPSRIPDNPPEKILQALTRAYELHPDAAIWYGVPLFGEEKNEEGLPIPVTAAEVKAEAVSRIEAAKEHALRWGWMYRAILKVGEVPARCWYWGVAMQNRFQNSLQRLSDYWKKCRQDARLRAKAIYTAELEHCRYGKVTTMIPEHRTMLGRSLETTALILELICFHAKVAGAVSPFFGLITAPLMIAQYAPIIFTPIVIIPLDPFLFVELPGEAGKLRHLGHWYWQKQPEAEDKLHLHV